MISARVAGVPRPRLLHRLAQLVVVDQPAGGLHRREERGLGVARRRLRLLRLRLGLDAADGVALLDLRQLDALALALLVLLRGAPARRARRRPRQPASSVTLPRVRKRSLLDLGDDRRALVARRRVEDGEEAARDQVEDAALVRRERVDVVVDLGRDDRVMVLDLGVVDDAPEREPVEPHHELRALRVLADRLQRGGDGLQLRDEVAGEVAGARARIRDRLLALVERLRGLQRAARGEAEAAVGVALERGQVVEERRALVLLLPLDRGDGAVLALHLLGDRGRLLAVPHARLVLVEPEPGVARVEARVDEPVRLRDEGLDLALALHDQRERRRLNPAERDDAADPGAAADRRRARRVHADEPVGLGAGASGRLERRASASRGGASRSPRGSPASSSRRSTAARRAWARRRSSATCRRPPRRRRRRSARPRARRRTRSRRGRCRPA